MKTRKKLKVFVAALLAVSITIVSAGCGSNKKSTNKSKLNPDKPVTITVWNYYNGDQLTGFDELVEKFNTTVGMDKGIVVVSESLGDIDTLADSLLDSVDGKAGAQECPTLASVYSETAYILNKKKALVNMDKYFKKEDLAKIVPGFLEEGRFGDKNELLSYPILKSTEIFAANETDWKDFAKATGVQLKDIKTKEDLVKAAQKYYKWTDDKTPDVPEDGKALYGRDSIANYIYLGSYELGHELFKEKNGKVEVDMDRDVFKTLWDNYYIPFINGYFAANAKFRSEDAKTGQILALTSSSSSTGYLPDMVTLEDDSTHKIDMYETKELLFKDAVVDSVVQQGANYCMLKKSTEAQREAAAEFLKWFSKPEQNMNFAVTSGYSPVYLQANDEKSITEAYKGDTSTSSGKNILNSLIISADAFTKSTAYAIKPFNGSKSVRAYLGDALDSRAKEDREKVIKKIKAGSSREEAVKEFSTDEYFDKWFDEITAEAKKLTSE